MIVWDTGKCKTTQGTQNERGNRPQLLVRVWLWEWVHTPGHPPLDAQELDVGLLPVRRLHARHLRGPAVYGQSAQVSPDDACGDSDCPFPPVVGSDCACNQLSSPAHFHWYVAVFISLKKTWPIFKAGRVMWIVKGRNQCTGINTLNCDRFNLGVGSDGTHLRISMVDLIKL